MIDLIHIFVGSLSGVTVAGVTGTSGSYSYLFTSPTAIAFDPYGYMYVLDSGNARVQRWLPGGSYGTTVASSTMNSPNGMQIDRLGNIAIADTSYHRIISFAMTCRKYFSYYKLKMNT